MQLTLVDDLKPFFEGLMRHQTKAHQRATIFLDPHFTNYDLRVRILYTRSYGGPIPIYEYKYDDEINSSSRYTHVHMCTYVLWAHIHMYTCVVQNFEILLSFFHHCVVCSFNLSSRKTKLPSSFFLFFPFVAFHVGSCSFFRLLTIRSSTTRV